ncbi:secreted subtilisin-like protease [Mycetocola reblochoni REB411]|uniref:Secreted subtilisin-like protease n=1 Tax=Mycetocola reblochoni REB411 TaxID=1255698 RepID=A0A1R4IP35_9MICO|nr:secreted subtilisin-like protease [Mycetocola reblochoni REB411]
MCLGGLVVGALAFAPQTALAATPTAGGTTTTAGTTTPAAATASELAVADAEGAYNYVVLGAPGEAATGLVAEAVAAAGGVVLTAHPAIGVTVAQSASGDFLATIRAADAVESAGPTRSVPVNDAEVVAGGLAAIGQPGSETALAADPGETAQWDMTSIGALAAHEVSTGSRDVVVGVLDSGIEDTHPDLATQVDPALSAGCAVNGVVNTERASWIPTASDHGTHVAGTIAAAQNGEGIVGVAPDTTLASVKVVNDDGYIYPEYAVCGFMWAAEHGFDVTNNSYYVDPWEFWCQTDDTQAAGFEAVRRAVAYSEGEGVLNVAAAGNSNYDLANKTTDSTSPNDVPEDEFITDRPVSEGCYDIPTELDGVVTVASVAQNAEGVISRSSFSNYGEGVIDIAAPGSRILSTVVGGGYGLKSGTSMASPHVAGVAALLKSVHPDAGPEALRQYLAEQATPLACPADAGAACADEDGSPFYGAGLVNAFAAVTEGVVAEPTAAADRENVAAGSPFTVLAANLTADSDTTLTDAEGTVLATGRTDSSGSVSLSGVLPLTTATGSATLTVTDGAGRSATVTITVTAALAAPTVTAPTDGQTLDDGTVTVTGTAEPGAEVTVVINGVPSGQESGARSGLQSTAVAAGEQADPVEVDPETGEATVVVQADAEDGSFSAEVSAPDGDYTLTVSQRLADGTLSATSEPIAFTVAVAEVEPTTPPSEGGSDADGDDGSTDGSGDASGSGSADGTASPAPAGAGSSAGSGSGEGSSASGSLATTGAEPLTAAVLAALLLAAGLAGALRSRSLRRDG